jgi:hypothetical protein
MPSRFEAAILSRILSPVTSLSNCANDSNKYKAHTPRTEGFDDLGKVRQASRQPVYLIYTTTVSTFLTSMSLWRRFRAGRSIGPPE